VTFDRDEPSPEKVKERLDKAWEGKKGLADMFGFVRRDYDLDPNFKRLIKYVPMNISSGPVVKKEVGFVRRPLSHKSERSAWIRKLLPLKETSSCKWIGLTPFPVGTRPHEHREPLGWFDGFVKSKHMPSLLKSSSDLLVSKHTLIQGGWATNRSILEQMGASPPSTCDASVEQFIDFSIDRLPKFGLPVISSVPMKWWLKAVTMNSKAYPGIVSSRILGSNKEKAYGGAVIVAQRMWDQIISSHYPTQDHSLWSIGGRARRQDMTQGKVPESRIVMMPETPNYLIAAAISQPLSKALKKNLLLKPHSECFMGQDVTLGGWSRIRDFVKPGTPTLELDWARFDSTVLENAMAASFCLLRTSFPRSKKIDKIFLFIMSGVIYKNVALSQRFIYKITRGVPSGSPFTSILDTMCNWVCLNYVLRKESLFGVSGPDDYKLAVAGDDTLIAFTNPDTFKLEDASYVSERFKALTNLQCEPEDMNLEDWFGGELFTPGDIEFAPSLLKTIIYQGLPGRRLTDLVKAISCPESRQRSYGDVLGTLQGYTSLPIINPLGRAFLEGLGAFVGEIFSNSVGVDPTIANFDPFCDGTYLPKCESLVVMNDLSEQMLRNPPYLRSDKWTGSQLRGLKRDAYIKIDLGVFGVPKI
jgi:hypothetical protein